MEKIVEIPAAPWLPDLPAENSPGATEALNVLPKTNKSYGSLSDLEALSTTPLTARCQGAISGRALDGTVTTFAGDATKLYRLTGAAFGNVSQGGGAPYTTASDEHWRFVQMGERVIATNYHDNVQSWTLGSSSAFADLSSGAPKCRHMAVVEPGFLMLGNLATAANGVHWSAINDPTSFPTPGSAAASLVQSGTNSTLQGGWVQAVVGAIGGAQGAIFMDRSIYRLEYIGPPEVFAFREIERARGTPAPYSVINIGSMAFYLADDGFYVFDGSQSKPLGASQMDKYFYTDIDQNNLQRVYGAADPINKVAVWAYPNASATNGNPNRLLIYNWETGWWSHAQITCEFLFRSLSQGTNLDSMDALGYTIDSLPFSLDSRFWTGGKLLLAAFDTSHNIGLFAGNTLAATVETAETDGGSGRRIYVSGIRPKVDGSATVTCSVGYRETFGASISYSTASSLENDGFCAQMIDTRLARARISTTGDFNHIWGAEARVSPSSER